MATESEKIWLEEVNKERDRNAESVNTNISLIENEIYNSFFLFNIINSIKNNFFYFLCLIILLIIIFRKYILLPALILFILIILKNIEVKKNLKDKFLLISKEKKPQLYNKLIKAKNELDTIHKRYFEELDRKCINWSTYPPDWELRKQKVFSRDNYCCTKCGWPTGFKRLRRELHVHHIIPISKKGTHNIENLITLCNICHREIDSSHRIVRKNASQKNKKNNHYKKVLFIRRFH